MPKTVYKYNRPLFLQRIKEEIENHPSVYEGKTPEEIVTFISEVTPFLYRIISGIRSDENYPEGGPNVVTAEDIKEALQ